MLAVVQRPPRRAVLGALGGFCCLALAATPAHALFANLSAGHQPPGWSSGIVPRNLGDTTPTFAPLPDQLLPTPAGTHFNWGISQNPAVTGTWHDELSLDDELIELVTRSNATFAAREWLQMNTGPMFVEGGRHTVRTFTDRLWETNEDLDFRGDNQWSAQYLWQPRTLPPNSTLDTKPSQAPNVNAFSFTRAPGTAWVVSGGGPALSTSVVVYDDYVNSTTGLANVLAQSSTYVVGSSAVAATLYPGIFRTTGSAGGNAVFAVADASGRSSASGVALWPSIQQPAGMLAQVFEAQFTAGEGEVITLTRFMGESDLEVRVFPPGLTAAGREAAPWVSVPRGGDDEYDDLVFLPAATGSHLIVVSRVDASHASEACGYSLELAQTGTVSAPSSFEASPLAAAPSPSNGPTRLSFTLAASAHVSLELYDVQGRAVRTLVDQTLPAGPVVRTWDGTNDDGRAMAPGRYFARLVAGSRRENISLVRIR